MISKCFKVFLLVSIISLIIVSIVIILVFTTFEAKNPVVHLYPVDLDKVEFFTPGVTIVNLTMIISVMNPNYGIYKTENTTGFVSYQKTVVAMVPVDEQTLPGHATTNVSVTAGLMSHKLMTNENFVADVGDGSFNMTTRTTFHGKVHLLKIIKIKALVNMYCDILFKMDPMDAVSSCVTHMRVL